jgi:hypothetical protein
MPKTLLAMQRFRNRIGSGHRKGIKQAGCFRFGELRERQGFSASAVDVGNDMWGVMGRGAALGERGKRWNGRSGESGGESQGERKPGMARPCSSAEMSVAQNDWVVPCLSWGFRLSAQKA